MGRYPRWGGVPAPQPDPSAAANAGSIAKAWIPGRKTRVEFDFGRWRSSFEIVRRASALLDTQFSLASV